MTLEEDIEEYSQNKPGKLATINEDGTLTGYVTMNDLFSPSYKRCISCELRWSCDRVQKDDEGNFLDKECVIEKDMLKLFFSSLDFNPKILDGLLLKPLIQNMFRMRRFYEWETVSDMIRTMRDPELFMHYKRQMSILFKSESRYVNLLKELILTKKEREGGSTSNSYIIDNRDSDSFSNKLATIDVEDIKDIDDDEEEEDEED